MFLIRFITSNFVRRFDLTGDQTFRRIIACLILPLSKVHVFKKEVFLKGNLFFDMISSMVESMIKKNNVLETCSPPEVSFLTGFN